MKIFYLISNLKKECNATLIDHSPESYNLIKNKIKDYISQSESYKSFISSEQPVGIHLTAVLPYEYAQKIDANTLLIRLSGYTIIKQKEKHKNVKTEYYYHIQDILDYGIVFKDDRTQYKKHIIFLHSLPNGMYIAVAIKSTQDGNELYLQTLYDCGESNLKRRKKTGTLLREHIQHEIILKSEITNDNHQEDQDNSISQTNSLQNQILD